MALPRSPPVQFRLNGTDINFKFRRASINHDADRPAVRFAPCCNPKEMTKGISHCTAPNNRERRSAFRTGLPLSLNRGARSPTKILIR